MSPLTERLAQVLAKWSTVSTEVITPDADIDDDLGIDSPARLELTRALIKEFGVIISDEEVFEARTVADLLAVLAARGVVDVEASA